MRKNDKRIEYETECFMENIIPFGSADVRAAIETALEGDHGGYWLAEQIREFIDSTETKLDDIDVCYIAYDSILQEARNDILELTEKDILNDTEEQIEVYGNYMCTSLDYSEEAKEELLKILSEIPEDDLTTAIKWLKNELG